MSVLAIDCGTTGVTALVVSEEGLIVSRGYREFPQRFPESGWVEHDPDAIWSAVLASCAAALEGHAVTAIGITNQRETAVLWDRSTLHAPRPAIVWQDRRTAHLCDHMREHEPRIAELTGLRLDPYFTATKLA
ncbi:MAG: glycerol kinase, partial [Frankiales bacterium]|nr:glycerol kinase [Frankiales bacterium]